jgi:hypothetical protein
MTLASAQPRPSYLRFAVDTARSLARYPGAVTTIGAVFGHDAGFGEDAPWWTKAAVDYLGRQVRPQMRVFEWGSGGSTAWLAGRGAQVTSVEHNPDWHAKVRARGMDADLRHVPGSAMGSVCEPYHTRNVISGGRFFDDYIAVIGEFPDESLDIVLVDGMCRAACFAAARPKVKRGGLLIIDDADMPPYRRLGSLVPGWEKRSFAGFKVSKDLRETAFYRRPTA